MRARRRTRSATSHGTTPSRSWRFAAPKPTSLQDLITDAAIPVGTWDQQPGELVHSGFLEALDAVWQEIAQAEELKKRRVGSPATASEPLWQRWR